MQGLLVTACTLKNVQKSCGWVCVEQWRLRVTEQLLQVRCKTVQEDEYLQVPAFMGRWVSLGAWLQGRY